MAKRKAEEPFPNYQVFINHRGADTKSTIASLIYTALRRLGLRVFLDQEELHGVDCLSTEIKDAIVSSSVHIAIFSPRYAESTWCLDELCLMSQHHSSTIIPIFCNVDPSDLRYVNKGLYAAAFIKHKDRGRMEVKKWEEALGRAANYTGYQFHTEKGDWGEFLYDIMCMVQNKVRREPLVVAEQSVRLDEAAKVRREPLVVAEKLVGLDKAACNLYNEILKQMEPSADTNIAGSAGLSGSGKTTLVLTSDPIHHRRRYDVFLSFRGLDARNTFVNKLFQSLQQEGFHVFLESERLEKGENIAISLEEAIKDSRLHIPIFSRGYAGSAWCLRELSLMWSCKASCAGTDIIPLFYDVEPWQVRYPDNEKSPYAEAFKRHSKRHSKEAIEEWKNALYEVSSFSGWFLPHAAASDEDKLVQQVTEGLQRYKVKDLHVAKHPVGLAARTIEVVNELLGIADHQRRVTFGIWGMGGSGKTTFSKSIYNHIHHMFQASCFLADIRATVRESAMGLRNLQKHTLKNLIKHDVDLYSVDQGKIEMQNRLASITALVVLDDVDDDEQLDALLGDWYGLGSIIIITTRSEDVLQQRQVDKIQAMGGLSPEEGVILFSWHAFGSESPQKDYQDMTQKIVDACDGLPLLLEILGAHLRSERNLRIWEEVLQKIQNVGYDKVYKSLRISYDALTFHEKQIFLDIACFFIGFSRLCGLSKEFYVKFWEVLGRKAVYSSLRNMEGKSLIVMHEYSRPRQIAFEFKMHDNVRDLGRQIVEEESPENPHIRSRLWRGEDIISAIGQAEETSIVQGIMWRGRVDFEVDLDSLSSMHNLKFMFCSDLFLKREITKLPQNLRCLVLVNSDLVLQMPKEIGQLKYLRYLHMNDTPLRFLPIEFGQLLSLEELNLIGCSLIELPKSFGNLINLRFLRISGNQMKSFPSNFSQLRSLEYLDAGSNQFEELPALPEGLIHLDVSESSRLQRLSSKLCGYLSLTEFPKVRTMHSLTKLSLDGCALLEELPALPRCLTKLSLRECYNLQRMSCMLHMENLQCLRFECKSLGELPELEGLQSLKKLELAGWDKMKLPILLPSGLIHLSINDSIKMLELPSMSHMRDLEILDLSGCESLIEIPKLDSMLFLRELILDNCWNLEKLPALPAGDIHVSTRNLTDKRIYPTWKRLLKGRRVTERGITSEDS